MTAKDLLQPEAAHVLMCLSHNQIKCLSKGGLRTLLSETAVTNSWKSMHWCSCDNHSLKQRDVNHSVFNCCVYKKPDWVKSKYYNTNNFVHVMQFCLHLIKGGIIFQHFISMGNNEHPKALKKLISRLHKSYI